MSLEENPPRSYLYVAGDDSRRIEKALAGEADAVVLDLEDAVVPSRKLAARQSAAQVLESHSRKPVLVRINPLASGLAEEDLEAIASPNLAGVRLPKTESAANAQHASQRLEGLGCPAVVQCLIESALGVEMAFEVARSHERVRSLSLGEADLAADLRLRDPSALGYARSRLVVASRAAEISSPIQSVYTDVRDLEGLRATTEAGRDSGFVGRSAVHPTQIPVINEVFTPSAEELRESEDLIERLKSSASTGRGTFLTEDGRFVDEAIVELARATLALARSGEEA